MRPFSRGVDERFVQDLLLVVLGFPFGEPMHPRINVLRVVDRKRTLRAVEMLAGECQAVWAATVEYVADAARCICVLDQVVGDFFGH